MECSTLSALGWNDGGLQQPPDNGNNNDAEPVDEDWPTWNEEIVADNNLVVQGAMPPQDQNSMVLNPSLGSDSSSDCEVVVFQGPHLAHENHEEQEHVFNADDWAIVP